MTAESSEQCFQLRPMTCNQRLLSQPDGSALFTQGDTSVLAATYGPTEVPYSKELIDRATIEVVFHPKVGQPGCPEKSLERNLRTICERTILSALHPRTAIIVVLQEINDAGSLLACCINAACTAMLDACVPMNYTIAAVHCVIDDDEKIRVDPTDKQATDAVAKATFVFDSVEWNVVGAVQTGCLTDVQFQTCLAMCRDASLQIFDFQREVYRKRTETQALH